MLKYSSLVHEKHASRMPLDLKWMVTEKMHGTNMSFHVDSNTIQVFRRNGPLVEGDKFYSWEKVKAKLTPGLLKIAEKVGGPITVFGELIGGYYPGCKQTESLIQKHIYYTPNHEYVVFDMYNHETQRFMDVDEFIGLAQYGGLHVIQPWYRNMTLDDIFKLNHETECTRVPEQFGLEPVPDNGMEGWVIRPETEPTDGNRCLLKHRTQRYKDRAEVDDVNAPPKKDKIHPNQDFLNRIRCMLTPERFQAVASKELEIQSKSEIGKYIGLIQQDLIDEIDNDERSDIDDDDNLFQDQNQVTLRQVNNMIGVFVRENITKFI